MGIWITVLGERCRDTLVDSVNSAPESVTSRPEHLIHHMWQKTDTLTVKSIGLCFYGREQLRARRCALSRGATRSEKSTPPALSEETIPGAHFILSNTLWLHDPGMGVLMYHAGRGVCLSANKKEPRMWNQSVWLHVRGSCLFRTAH